MNIEYMNELRQREVRSIMTWYRPLLAGKRVLEIGSGTGVQLVELGTVAREVVGIDLADGTYHEHADTRIVAYDGHHIPFPDASFDLVFSSNVLEHIAHRDAFQDEIARVLKPGGYCIHMLPSQYWRLWTTVGTIIVAPARLAIDIVASLRRRRWCLPRTWQKWLDLLIGDRHGEFGNRLTEFFHFMPGTWRRYFAARGWHIVEVRPGGLAYEGNMILAHLIRWSPRSALARAIRPAVWRVRAALSHVVGAACYVFVLRSSCNAMSAIRTDGSRAAMSRE